MIYEKVVSVVYVHSSERGGATRLDCRNGHRSGFRSSASSLEGQGFAEIGNRRTRSESKLPLIGMRRIHNRKLT